MNSLFFNLNKFQIFNCTRFNQQYADYMEATDTSVDMFHYTSLAFEEDIFSYEDKLPETITDIQEQKPYEQNISINESISGEIEDTNSLMMYDKLIKKIKNKIAKNIKLFEQCKIFKKLLSDKNFFKNIFPFAYNFKNLNYVCRKGEEFNSSQLIMVFDKSNEKLLGKKLLFRLIIYLDINKLYIRNDITDLSVFFM